MADLRENEELDREVFAFVRKSEEAALEAARKWAKAVRESAPVEMPMVRDLVNGVFDFTEEILRIQREFAHNVLHQTRTMVQRMSALSPKPAPRAKARATGPPARRATTASKAKKAAA